MRAFQPFPAFLLFQPQRPPYPTAGNQDCGARILLPSCSVLPSGVVSALGSLGPLPLQPGLLPFTSLHRPSASALCFHWPTGFLTCSVLSFSSPSACPLQQIWTFPDSHLSLTSWSVSCLLLLTTWAGPGASGFWKGLRGQLRLPPLPRHPPRTNCCRYGGLTASGGGTESFGESVWVLLRRWAKVTFSYPRELEQICFLVIPHWSLNLFLCSKKSAEPVEQRLGLRPGGLFLLQGQGWLTVNSGSLPLP